MRRIALFLLLFGVLSVVASAQSTTWTDPATKLMWAGESSNGDVDWNQAKDYCEKLKLGGYSNWRLATIDELASIYDQSQNVEGRHVKGGIKFHDGWWAWSNSAGTASGQAWALYFTNGRRYSNYLDASYIHRALCVRRP